MKKRNVRIILDTAMTVLLPVLMAYSLVGEALHEMAGSLMFALFIAHHVVNRKAAAARFRGKQNPARIMETVITILLIPVMILQPVTGITMSKHLYTSLPTEGFAYISRVIHLPLAYWGFVLMSLHLGTHLERFLQGKNKRKKLRTVIYGIWVFIASYGIYAFIKRSFAEYLFLRSQFVFLDLDESRLKFFLDHLAVIALFALIGYLAFHRLKKTGRLSEVRRR